MKRPKLSKKQATAFYKAVIGHASGIEIDDSSALPAFKITAGMMRYEAWMSSGRILLYMFLNGDSLGVYYFDPVTFEYDWQFTERERGRDSH